MAWTQLVDWTLQTLGTLPGVRIVAVSGRNRAGLGRLQYDPAAGLSWCAPGGVSLGAPVDVSGGGNHVVADGADATRWVEVEVTSAALPDAVSMATVRIDEVFNDAVGGDDVSAAEAASGGAGTTRTLALTNRTAGSLTVRVWLGAYTAKQHQLRAAGGSWSAPTSAAAGIVLTIGGGRIVTFNLRRQLLSLTPASPGERVVLQWQATAGGGGTELGAACGWYRVFNAPSYRLYHDAGRTPVIGRAAPLAELATLPAEVTQALADGDHRFVLTRFNGAWESGTGPVRRIVLVAATPQTPPPSRPQALVLAPLAGGAVRVTAAYYPRLDGTSAATQWALRWAVGAMPAAGTPQRTVVVTGQWPARLDTELPAQVHGETLYVRVWLQRVNGADTTDGPAVGDSLLIDSAAPAAPAGLGSWSGTE